MLMLLIPLKRLVCIVKLGYTRVYLFCYFSSKKLQVGKDQEKAQSEKDSSKNRGGEKLN